MNTVTDFLQQSQDVAAGVVLTTSEPLNAPSLLEQIILARATTLARIGHYAAAESLLSELIHKQRPNALAIDLLARMRAQQGKLGDAESLWLRASALDGRVEDYKEALHRIEKMQSRPAWFVFAPSLTFIAVVIVCVLTGAVGLNKYAAHPRDGNAQTEDVTQGHKSPDPIQQQESLASLKLNVAGARVSRNETGVVVSFERGLFGPNAKLKPVAKSLLRALAEQLEPYIGQISLRIAGHTDNSPARFSGKLEDNVALGMARAMAVFDFFKEETKLPASMLSVSSAGEAQPPFPNDIYENRIRNRTVSLLLVEVKK